MKKITTFLFGIFCMLSVANAQSIMLFDFDTVNANHVFLGSWNGTYPNTAFAKVANPYPSGINTSANVGKYTANGGANAQIVSDTIGGATIAAFDFATHPYFTMKVWVGKPLTISVEFENNNYYPSFATLTDSVTTTNQWVSVEFNCSALVSGGTYGWGTYNIIGLSFDKHLFGGTVANDVYYFDDMELSATSITTSLSTVTASEFSVYPNPATNYILTKNAQKVTISDLNGRIVKEANQTEKVNIASLAKGAYIVKVVSDNVTKVGKLIKE